MDGATCYARSSEYYNGQSLMNRLRNISKSDAILYGIIFAITDVLRHLPAEFSEKSPLETDPANDDDG
jgi:hypothetical protein